MDYTQLDLESSGKDLDILEDVTEYLGRNYVEYWDQGPVWITGSSLDTADPNDYDIVVQRSFQEVPEYADQRAVAKLLNCFKQEDINYKADLQGLNSQLEKSNNINKGNNVNFYPEPVRRFKMEIQEVPIDLSFNNDRPSDKALKIL